MPSPARVLLVGAGSISREYALNHLTPESTGCVVAGVVDTDLARARELAAEVGSLRLGARITMDGGNKYRSRAVGGPARGSVAADVPSYRSLDDALSVVGKEIDVVYIGTPPGSHWPLTERTLESGKHVLLEKPLATTAEDADAIVEAADKAKAQRGLVLGMNIGMRYNTALQEMRNLIFETDEFGIMDDSNSSLKGTLRLHFRQWPREWQTQPWCASRSEGGPCREVGTHFFSALLEFASCKKSNGSIDRSVPLKARIKATVSFPTKPPQMMGAETFDCCEDSAFGTIELKGGSLPTGGLIVDFSVSTKNSLERDIYELTIAPGGDETNAITPFDFCSLRNERTGLILVENANYGRRECVEALLSAATCADVKNNKSLVTARDGRNAQYVLDAIMESRGEWKEIELA